MGINIALGYLHDYLANQGMVLGDTRLVVVTPTLMDRAKLRAALAASLRPCLRPSDGDFIYDDIRITVLCEAQMPIPPERFKEWAEQIRDGM